MYDAQYDMAELYKDPSYPRALFSAMLVVHFPSCSKAEQRGESALQITSSRLLVMANGTVGTRCFLRFSTEAFYDTSVRSELWAMLQLCAGGAGLRRVGCVLRVSKGRVAGGVGGLLSSPRGHVRSVLWQANGVHVQCRVAGKGVVVWAAAS